MIFYLLPFLFILIIFCIRSRNQPGILILLIIRKPAITIPTTETETKGESEEAASDSETDNKEEVFSADENENASSDEEADGETEDRIYLIPGDDKSSNRYEKAQHLSYTTTVKYTIQNLSVLDSYGLKITRNEIYARHGRIFNDQELQEYFQRQNWYVPQTASNDFDDSCLNEVEKYNIQLISTYEQQAGGN